MWGLKYTNWKPHPKHQRRPSKENFRRYTYMQKGAMAITIMYYVLTIYSQWCPLPGGLYVPLQPGGLRHWLHYCKLSEFTGTTNEAKSIPHLRPRSAYYPLTHQHPHHHHTPHRTPEPHPGNPCRHSHDTNATKRSNSPHSTTITIVNTS